MAIDWYNITFNDRFIASDSVEAALSKPEDQAGRAFSRICNDPKNITSEDYTTLLYTLALIACRHPDHRSQHQQYVEKIGRGIIAARAADDYDAAAAAFRTESGSMLERDIYEDICSVPEDELLETLAVTPSLPDYHPALPAQILSLEAVPEVLASLMLHDCSVFVALQPSFVLSNRPVPTQNQQLSQPFSVPVSPLVALKFRPRVRQDQHWPHIQTLQAMAADIAEINAEQCNRADMIVGPDQALVEQQPFT